MTEYRSCPEFPGYLIGDDGGIISPRGHRMSPGPDRHGYLKFNSTHTGRRTNAYVHIWVCTAFHGPRPTELHQAAHGNSIRTDNRASNLRWATPESNRQDAMEIGSLRGERNGRATVQERQVRAIRSFIRLGIQARVIAELYDVGLNVVQKISSGRTWRHIA